MSILLTTHASAQTSLIDTENYQALTSDRRAINVGDILTVLVAESTSAKSSVGTNAKNKTNLSFSANTLTAKADAGLGMEGG
ncbi:flagellar basal body L-ring protein FlgH, partial [Acinetobacter baumannii]|uniref:flagellar basal body L-ring protein FlgH n=1 Tax=Acinetobacter baumannii TaxID=470 RepID=UPI0029C433C8